MCTSRDYYKVSDTYKKVTLLLYVSSSFTFCNNIINLRVINQNLLGFYIWNEGWFISNL